MCVSINETFFVVFRTFWFDFILAATFPGLDDDVAAAAAYMFYLNCAYNIILYAQTMPMPNEREPASYKLSIIMK